MEILPAIDLRGGQVVRLFQGDYDQMTVYSQDPCAQSRAFAQAGGEAYLRATPGSKFCYTFVQTQVEASEETTEHLREQGENGEDTYCFYMTTVFVPENEAAEHWSMAGNTGEYTGNDPAVPRGAMEHYRCGYITRTSAGWQGQIVGTGW